MIPKYLKKCTCGGTAVLYESQGFSWERVRYYYACDRCEKETRKCEDKHSADLTWNELNSKLDFDYKPGLCPFCKGTVRIAVCDDEGNLHDDEYENNPWSGLRYQLVHDTTCVPMHKSCPIATFEGESIGTRIYDSRQEAAEAWDTRY